MPYNPESKARLNEFLAGLAECGIVTVHVRQSIYTINDKRVSIRTTTKPGPVFWYDASINIVNSVDYLIYQTDSKYNFVLFPASFLQSEYSQLKDSNRPNAKIFYIDWPNKIIASKPSYRHSIEPYCCSAIKNQEEWISILAGKKPDDATSNSGTSESDYEHYSIDDGKAFEGYKQDRSILASARNQKIAKQRKALDKYVCQVCGFSLTIGGNSIIECHHLYPLSESLETETTIDDLVSLCPTCHRIAHLRRPPYTPQQIIEVLKNA